MRRHWFIITTLAWLVSKPVFANTDINNLFDARSTAMGATGVAFLDSAGAIPINPAALDQIDKLALTLDGTAIAVQPQAPYVITLRRTGGVYYQNYETIRFGRTVAPLAFAGGAYRILERVVIGAAVYPIIGMGTTTKYRPAPELMPALEVKNELAAALLEIGVPVSVRVLDSLSVAAMWRISYMSQSASQPLAGGGVGGLLVGPSGEPISAKLATSGWNLGGLQLGLLYKPLSFFRVGLSYRSKVVVDGNGTTTSVNPLDGSSLALATRNSFTNPHAFRGGVAVSALQDKLLISADFKYLLYAEAYKTIDTTVVMNGVPVKTHTIANWKNAGAALVGAEYAVLPTLRLRAGYELVTSATPKSTAKSTMAPPGISHGFALGFGLKVLDSLNVDVAAVYIAYETRVDKATPNNAGPGIYASNTGQVAVSATYHM